MLENLKKELVIIYEYYRIKFGVQEYHQNPEYGICLTKVK